MRRRALPEEYRKALRDMFFDSDPSGPSSPRSSKRRPPNWSGETPPLRDEFSTEMRNDLGLETTPPSLASLRYPSRQVVRWLAEGWLDEQAGAQAPVYLGNDPAYFADALSIPSERFRVLPGPVPKIDYNALKIDDAYYQVNLPTIVQMQHAVFRGFASGAGFIVQRLQPTGGKDDARSAFLLYTGIGSPLEFVGVESLARLAATASYADFWQSGGPPRRQLNLTLVGHGRPIDFDAAKLTIALRFQHRFKSLPELTFRTEERFRSFTEGRGPDLSMERIYPEPCRGGECVRLGVGKASVSLGVGKAIIRVVAATIKSPRDRIRANFQIIKERVIEAVAVVRECVANALVAYNPRLLTDADPRRIDHAAFDKLPREVRRKIINAAVMDARRAYDDLRNQGSGTGAYDAKIKIESEIDKQKSSVRFAGLELAPAIRTAAIGPTNAPQ
jgi:hypothetical protein